MRFGGLEFRAWGLGLGLEGVAFGFERGLGLGFWGLGFQGLGFMVQTGFGGQRLQKQKDLTVHGC